MTCRRNPGPDWTEEELLLLRSAADNRPPSRSLAVTLAAVGAGAAASAAATAASASPAAAGAGAGASVAKWGSGLAIAKWMSVVALGGVLTASGIAYERHAREQQRSISPGKRPHAAAPRQPAAAPIEDSLPPPSAATVADDPRAAPAARAALTPTPRRRAEPPPSQPDLSREIAALDEARTALRQGRATEALADLDRYDAAFRTTANLTLEAAALRIEALFHSGDRTHARALADAFLAKHATSPYAARIRALLNADARHNEP